MVTIVARSLAPAYFPCSALALALALALVSSTPVDRLHSRLQSIHPSINNKHSHPPSIIIPLTSLLLHPSIFIHTHNLHHRCPR